MFYGGERLDQFTRSKCQSSSSPSPKVRINIKININININHPISSSAQSLRTRDISRPRTEDVNWRDVVTVTALTVTTAEILFLGRDHPSQPVASRDARKLYSVEWKRGERLVIVIVIVIVLLLFVLHCLMR